jgi:hypothetical protein
MPKHTPEQIENIADSIMPNFIPRDASLSDLSFVFTVDGMNYKVAYRKDKQGSWKLISQEQA